MKLVGWGLSIIGVASALMLWAVMHVGSKWDGDDDE